jgi:hypothetical protein
LEGCWPGTNIPLTAGPGAMGSGELVPTRSLKWVRPGLEQEQQQQHVLVRGRVTGGSACTPGCDYVLLFAV